ncbi:MAG: hypothetical protein C0501_23830 [Isosphaera sp.]|nr:hypothetical protein [Isosphaera sp.]
MYLARCRRMHHKGRYDAYSGERGCSPRDALDWRKMSKSLVTVSSASLGRIGFSSLPRLITNAGERATKRFVEFFTANIRNKNTRLTEKSDCDLLVVLTDDALGDDYSNDEALKTAHNKAQAVYDRVWDLLTPLKLEPPKKTGTFSTPTSQAQLCSRQNVGNSQEDMKVLAKQQLLLLESQPVYRTDECENLTTAVVAGRGSDGLTEEQRAGLVREEHRLRQDGAFDPTDVEDARRRTLANIVSRQGQGTFRAALLELYNGRCAVSGCAVEAVLEAAHITPYLGPKTNDPTNGLLLRSDIHALFDLGLVAVETKNMTVLVARALDGSEYEALRGRSLHLPDEGALQPSEAALDRHRTRAASHSLRHDTGSLVASTERRRAAFKFSSRPVRADLDSTRKTPRLRGRSLLAVRIWPEPVCLAHRLRP